MTPLSTDCDEWIEEVKGILRKDSTWTDISHENIVLSRELWQAITNPIKCVSSGPTSVCNVFVKLF